MTNTITLPRSVVEQALEHLTCPVDEPVREAFSKALEQPQGEQPTMTPVAQRKLDDLLTRGYQISGYSVYHDTRHQHGFVTTAGLVGWWKPEGAEYPQPQGKAVGWLPLDCRGGYNFQQPQVEQESVAHSIVAGALFDFMGWLTSRDDRLVLSSTDDAVPAVEVITAFAKMRGLSLDEAMVRSWQDSLMQQPKRKPLTEDEIAELMMRAWGCASIAPRQAPSFARAIERAHGIGSEA